MRPTLGRGRCESAVVRFRVTRFEARLVSFAPWLVCVCSLSEFCCWLDSRRAVQVGRARMIYVEDEWCLMPHRFLLAATGPAASLEKSMAVGTLGLPAVESPSEESTLRPRALWGRIRTSLRRRRTSCSRSMAYPPPTGRVLLQATLRRLLGVAAPTATVTYITRGDGVLVATRIDYRGDTASLRRAGFVLNK